jgi:hypothetical protein
MTFSPPFLKVFTGVENNVDRGDIRTILSNVNGNALATESNAMAQLCIDDILDKMKPRRIPIKNRQSVVNTLYCWITTELLLGVALMNSICWD